MKSVSRMGLLMVLFLGLSFAVLPAFAAAERTEVTGKFFFIGEPSEHPRARLWTTGQYVDHCRNDLQLFYFDTDFERLNGWGQGITRCEFHYTPDYALTSAHIWGTTKITSDIEGQNVLWECNGNGGLDATWSFKLDYVCHGRGENEGLFARLLLSSLVFDEEWGWYYPLTGEVLAVSAK